MALTERSRNKIYETFNALIDDEQAVDEMLSYFPARDVEEPVTKDFLRAELASLRTDLHDELRKLQARMVASSIAVATAIIAFSNITG